MNNRFNSKRYRDLEKATSQRKMFSDFNNQAETNKLPNSKQYRGDTKHK